MVRTLDKVRDDFPSYTRFMKRSKLIQSEKIEIKPVRRRDWGLGRSVVADQAISGDKSFEAEISIKDPKNYKFKIFAEFFVADRGFSADYEDGD